VAEDIKLSAYGRHPIAYPFYFVVCFFILLLFNFFLFSIVTFVTLVFCFSKTSMLAFKFGGVL
jgi:hypothetical protein